MGEYLKEELRLLIRRLILRLFVSQLSVFIYANHAISFNFLTFVVLFLLFYFQENLPVLKLGSSDNLRAGEWVISIGSPAGLSNSVSCGVVSTVGRKSTELRLGSNEDMEYIQTDAPINVSIIHTVSITYQV